MICKRFKICWMKEVEDGEASYIFEEAKLVAGHGTMITMQMVPENLTGTYLDAPEDHPHHVGHTGVLITAVAAEKVPYATNHC